MRALSSICPLVNVVTSAALLTPLFQSLDSYGWRPASFTSSVLKTLMSSKVGVWGGIDARRASPTPSPPTSTWCCTSPTSSPSSATIAAMRVAMPVAMPVAVPATMGARTLTRT